jgi:hypothetical protein
MLNPLSPGPREAIYLPTLAEIAFKSIYSIEINLSGRLQYYRQQLPGKRKRITKTEFSKAYNHSRILGLQPVQSADNQHHFLLKFFTI